MQVGIITTSKAIRTEFSFHCEDDPRAAVALADSLLEKTIRAIQPATCPDGWVEVDNMDDYRMFARDMERPFLRPKQEAKA